MKSYTAESKLKSIAIDAMEGLFYLGYLDNDGLRTSVACLKDNIRATKSCDNRKMEHKNGNV